MFCFVFEPGASNCSVVRVHKSLIREGLSPVFFSLRDGCCCCCSLSLFGFDFVTNFQLEAEDFLFLLTWILSAYVGTDNDA